MADVLAWQAPVANAARMPPPWTDVEGAAVLGMVERLGVNLPTLLLAISSTDLSSADELAMGWNRGTSVLASADPVLRLQGLYAVWAERIDQGAAAPDLEVPAKQALASIQASPMLSTVYQRILAISELPNGTVPTFSSIMVASRPAWRTLSGRDVRIEIPRAPSRLTPWVLVGAAAAGFWYIWRHRP